MVLGGFQSQIDLLRELHEGYLLQKICPGWGLRGPVHSVNFRTSLVLTVRQCVKICLKVRGNDCSRLSLPLEMLVTLF